MPDLGHAALRSAGQALGLNLTDTQLKLLGRYAGLLREWNRRINLVSRKDANRILSYHVIDSLAASSLVPPDTRACDIGTGAGLPGIPLAIARPDVEMLLVESSHKKCLFLETAVRELGFANARTIEGRAESLEPLGCAVVLSRLTGPLKRVIKEAGHHRSETGIIVLFKTRDTAREVTAILPLMRRHGLALAGTHDVPLPVSGILRRFVIIGRLPA